MLKCYTNMPIIRENKGTYLCLSVGFLKRVSDWYLSLTSTVDINIYISMFYDQSH